MIRKSRRSLHSHQHYNLGRFYKEELAEDNRANLDSVIVYRMSICSKCGETKVEKLSEKRFESGQKEERQRHILKVSIDEVMTEEEIMCKARDFMKRMSFSA